MGASTGEYHRSVLLLSCAFFFVFTAFNTVQMLISSSLSDKALAYTTLSTIYLVFAATNIVAPKVVDMVGPRLGLFMGSIAYIILVAANIYPVWATLVPASALVGVGAGVLWTSWGIYMSRIAAREAATTGEKVDDVSTRFNGTFSAAFQFNGAVGLMLAAVCKTVRQQRASFNSLPANQLGAPTLSPLLPGVNPSPHLTHTHTQQSHTPCARRRKSPTL